MQTTTLILGLIAATFLLLGGCSAYVFGSVGVAGYEAFGDEDDQASIERNEEVQGAGAGAIVVAIWLFLAAGLAKVALRVSMVLLVLSLPMLFGLLMMDGLSLFAATYYLGLLLIGVCSILMILAWRRQRKTS